MWLDKHHQNIMQELSKSVAKLKFSENDTDSLDLRFILDTLLTNCDLKW